MELAMNAQTTDTGVLDKAAVQEFAAGLHGALIRPGDGGYDTGRKGWDGMIDRHPALIARCASTADVACAVKFARNQNLPVSVRGGGHSTAGFAVCDGGLVIDLSRMKGISVDPHNRTARAEPGLTLKDLI